MKRKFTNVFFLVAIAVAAMTSFVSCKDYEEDLWNESNAQYKNLDQSLQALKSDLERRVSVLEAFKTTQEGINQNLQDQIDDLRQKLSEIDSCKCDLSEYAKKSDLDGLASQVDLDALQTVVQNYYDELKTLIGEKCDCEARIAALEDAIDKIKSCCSDLDALISRIEDAEGRLDKIEQNFVSRQELIDSIASVRRTIDAEVLNLQTKISEIVIRLESVEGVAADALGLAKDDSVRIDKLGGRVDYVINLSKNDSIRIDNLQKQIDNINVQGYDDSELRRLITNLENTLKSLIQGNTNRIQALEDLDIDNRLKALEDSIKKVKSCLCEQIDLSGYATTTELKEVRDSAMRALNLAKDDSIRIDELKALFDGLDTSKYQDQWIKDQFKADKERMDILGDSIKKIMTEMGTIKTSITTLETTLREKIQSDSTYLKDLIDALEAKIPTIPDMPGMVDLSTLRDSVKTLMTDMSSVQDRLQTAEQQLAELPEIKEKITDLRTDVNKAIDRISVVENTVNTLTNDVSDIQDYLDQLITGIEIQAVTNPLYGTLNTPFGFTSNLLLTYYGTPTNGTFKFPTASATYQYNPDYFGDASMNEFRTRLNNVAKTVAQTLPTDENGKFYTSNAGNIYLTVNPTNKDFSGTAVQLVNSRGEQSPFSLTPLAQSDRLIDFGWSITRGNNGLYRTEVSINSDFEKATPKFGVTEENWKAAYNDLKNAYKEARAEKKNFAVSFTKLAKGMISAAGEVAGLAKMSAPAYAIKLEKNGVETTSKYELAAISLQMLSYNSADPLDQKNIARRGIDALERAITKIAGKIQEQITKKTDKMIFDVSRIGNVTNTGFDITVSNAEITKLEGLTVTIPYEDIHDMFIVNPETGEEVPLETDGHQDIVAKVVATSNNKITFQFEKRLSDYFKNLEGLLKYLYDSNTDTGYFDDLNDLLKWMGGTDDTEGIVDKFGEKAVNYVEKFASVFARFMKPSDWLQPIAFVYDGKLKPLTSASFSHPRVIAKPNVTLVLTSRTGELLVPAYKKWVAVTGVYNTDGTPAANSVLEAANKGDMNKILEGSKRHISLTLQKGYIYEITLQCVDFKGYVSTKSYHVRVAD